MASFSDPELPPLPDATRADAVDAWKREVSEALLGEQEANGDLRYRVVSVVPYATYFQVMVEQSAEQARRISDEFENGRAAWHQPSQVTAHAPGQQPGAAAVAEAGSRGTARVLAVMPNEGAVEIDKLVGDAPKVGDEIVLTPFDFLGPFRNKWLVSDGASMAAEVASWISSSGTKIMGGEVAVPTLEHIERHQPLAPSQRAAFRLLDQRCGFLWGPPGTGKTHTLAAMVAGFVLRNPRARVCIMATRHSATDQLLVAADKLIEKACGQGPRPKAARLGAFFDAGILRERPHLRPGMSPELLDQLSAHEYTRPDERGGQGYQQWKNELDSLWGQARSEMEGVLETCSLVACTTAFAGLRMLDLDAQRFDLVVVDESSLLSLPQCVLLGRLGARVLFAGDPRQLAPISLAATEGRSRGRGPFAAGTADQARVARSAYAKRWLARSILDWIPEAGSPATAQLVEQGRMSVEVMEIVSRLFYDGRLVLGPWVQGDRRWDNQRIIDSTPSLGVARLVCLDVMGEALPGQSGRGLRRPSSAEAIARAVREMVMAGTDGILVIAPFRDQVAEIRTAILRACGTGRRLPRGVDVRTVHRAQGLERHTVIFDPVQGWHFALSDPVAGSRSVNVAFSRAMARLVVVLSEQDAMQNPMLARVRAQGVRVRY